MKKYSPALLSALLISSLMTFAPLTQADEEAVDNISTEKSYGDKVGEKALSGFTNFNTAILEIPKNIINTTNDSNVAFGFIGGTVKGVLNTFGRMMSGLTDLVTAPILTKQIVKPNYIWEDFDVDTTYGKVFRLDNDPKPEPEPEPALKNTADDTAAEADANRAVGEMIKEENRKRDLMFKKAMTK